MNSWTWVLRYAVAFVLALLLAGILGGSGLFQNARITADGPSAADLVRFFGQGAALLLLWLAADRAALSIREDGGWRTLLRHTLIPLATLIVLALAYPVPLLLLHPVMSEPAMMGYRWFFVLAISAAALWLVLRAYAHAEALSPSLAAARRALWRPTAPPARLEALAASPARCAQCGSPVPADTAACPNCGRRAAA